MAFRARKVFGSFEKRTPGLKGGSEVSSKAERWSISSGRRKDEDFLLDERVERVPMADKGCDGDEQRAEMLKLARMTAHDL